MDSQRRYEQLLGADRLTLTSAFEKAGWRTVFDVPANTRDWPEGEAFYGFDQLYDARNVGYQGPQFGYAAMPDQYTLDAFRRHELADAAGPVMGEIDLVSSHHPWAPSPLLVPWAEVGDGSVFDDAPTQPASSDVQTLYGQSIEYTMDTLVSWLEQHPDPNLVLLVLGDHQPHSYVTGPDPGHDVPISLIARDPRVLGRIAGWDWQRGHPPGAGRAGLADGHGPRPVPRRVQPVSSRTCWPSDVSTSTDAISSAVSAVAPVRCMVLPGRPCQVATCSVPPSRVRTTSA